MAFDNESICCASRSQFDCKDDKEKNQERFKTTKYIRLFKKFDEIEDPDDDIDIEKLVFIGSNREKFNFNTFEMPLNFL